LVSNLDMAKKALERSGRWLRGASRALDDVRWDDVVFSSQMAVEVSSKAVLLALSIEFPKQHDISAVFRELSGREDIPSWFPVAELASTISKFAELRSLAEYAYEEGIGIEYFRDYAPSVLKTARGHIKSCERLLGQKFGSAFG